VPDGSLCTASVEQIFPRDCVQRNCFEFALYIMTASPIASVRVFETVRVTQMSSRYVRYARNAVCARSRDHHAERSLVLGICFWPFIVRQHAPIVHPLLARPRPTPQPLPRERFRSLALFGHRAMSGLSPLCDQKRTYRPYSGPGFRSVHGKSVASRGKAIAREVTERWAQGSD
jgi:hypothetical protein